MPAKLASQQEPRAVHTYPRECLEHERKAA